MSKGSKFEAKNYQYRGKTVEELTSMRIQEFSALLPSRRRRTLKSIITNRKADVRRLLAKIVRFKEAAANGKNPTPIKTHFRDMVILPQFVNSVISIYNGRYWSDIQIRPEMIGSLLADFAPSKKLVRHQKAGVGATRSSSSTSLK